MSVDAALCFTAIRAPNVVMGVKIGHALIEHRITTNSRLLRPYECTLWHTPSQSVRRSATIHRRNRDRANRTSAQVRIGVISDTHGLLRPEAERYLTGVVHIVHAGDIGRPDVIARLRQIAPVTAIRGNVDTGDWAKRYPDTEIVRLGGRAIHLLHDIHDLKLNPVSSGIDVVISGHSHRPRIETVHGVLYLNPGSAGPRRFNLPITLATLELNESGHRPIIHDLCAAHPDQASKHKR